eukprot:33452_1
MEQKRTDENDERPLTYAAWHNHLPAVIELIKNGANPFPPPDKNNATPYSQAVHSKNKAVIRFYEAFTEFMTGIKINKNMNIKCLICYQYNLCHNKYDNSDSMKVFTYCLLCA